MGDKNQKRVEVAEDTTTSRRYVSGTHQAVEMGRGTTERRPGARKGGIMSRLDGACGRWGLRFR